MNTYIDNTRYAKAAAAVVIATLTCFSPVVSAQAVSGTSLNIENLTVIPASANEDYGVANALFGFENSVGADSGVNLLLGFDHIVQNYSSRNLVIGRYNEFIGAEDSIAVGATLIGMNLVSSSLFGGGHMVQNVSGSLITGHFSSVSNSTDVLVSGTNNSASNLSYGAAVGYGLIANGSYHLVLGCYNIVQAASAPRLLTVGNGTSSAARKDALVVFRNGDVSIPKRQGDILMGEFGNPE